METSQTKMLDLLGYKGVIEALSGAMIHQEASPRLDCVEYYKGHVRRSRGFRAFSSAMNGNPRLFREYVKMSGSGRLVGITDEEVAYYVGGDPLGSWTTVETYAGSTGRVVEAVQFIDQLIFTDGENVVKVYDSDEVTSLGGLSAISLTAAKHIASFYSYVLLANTYEGSVWNPQRVRWCDTGAPDDWNTGNAGFSDLTDTPGEITGIENMYDKLFAYKERSIYGASYTRSTDVFSWYLVHPDTGLFASTSLRSIGGKHFFLGYDNIYTFDGATLTPIGDAIVPRIFGPDSAITTEQLRKAQGVYVAKLQEYWLAFPSLGRWPQYIERYHLPTQTWWPRSTGFSIRCFGNSSDVQSYPWMALVGDWNSQTKTWAEMKGSGSGDIRGVLVGGDDGEVLKLDWENETDAEEYPEAFIESPDFLFQRATRVKVYEVECQGGDYITASYSTDGGETWTELATRRVPSTWGWVSWSIDKVLERCRLRLTLGEANIETRKQILSAIEKRR